jgi:hypothetical protein
MVTLPENGERAKQEGATTRNPGLKYPDEYRYTAG